MCADHERLSPRGLWCEREKQFVPETARLRASGIAIPPEDGRAMARGLLLRGVCSFRRSGPCAWPVFAGSVLLERSSTASGLRESAVLSMLMLGLFYLCSGSALLCGVVVYFVWGDLVCLPYHLAGHRVQVEQVDEAPRKSRVAQPQK